MPLRIAYLADCITNEDARFLRRLVEGPYDPVFILFHAPDDSVHAFLRQFSRLQVRWHPFNIAPPARFPRLLGPLRRFMSTRKAARALRADLQELRPDVLHAGWLQTCGVVAAMSGFHPLLLMPWGSDVLLWPERYRRERWLAKYALRAADAVTCDAMAVRRAVQNLCPIPDNRFEIFPWGIELPLFHPGRRRLDLRASWGAGPDDPVMVVSRSLEPIYGIDLILDAFARLTSAHPRLRAVIVGGGSLEAELKRKAAELSLGGRVHFTGRVPYESMGEYVASADLYVSASRSDGTSLSLLEGMACGLPVVVTDILSIREWVEEGVHGRIVPIGDAEAMAKAIDGLLRDPAARAAMSARNRKVASERADWDRNFERCGALYERLVAACRPAATGAAGSRREA